MTGTSFVKEPSLRKRFDEIFNELETEVITEQLDEGKTVTPTNWTVGLVKRARRELLKEVFDETFSAKRSKEAEKHE